MRITVKLSTLKEQERTKQTKSKKKYEGGSNTTIKLEA